MPADKASRGENHYGQVCAAGTDGPQTCKRPSPETQNRIALMIQNTGGNDGFVRFGQPVQGDGSDMLFQAGSGLLFDRADTCPRAAIYVGSADGTTFTIYEKKALA